MQKMMMLTMDDPRWVEFVAGCADASPFHHPAWATLLADCYRYRPLALALTGSDGRLNVGLPVIDVSRPLARRRWTSLPFTDYCPILSRDRLPDDLVNALTEVMRERRVDRFEQRAELPRHTQVHSRLAAVRHTLALSADPTNHLRDFSKMHQRNIRKAERAGVHIRIGCSTEDVLRYYDLHLLTHRRLGIPSQPGASSAYSASVWWNVAWDTSSWRMSIAHLLPGRSFSRGMAWWCMSLAPPMPNTGSPSQQHALLGSDPLGRRRRVSDLRLGAHGYARRGPS